MIIRYLKGKGKIPILAVDADANANLGDSLGLRVNRTVGRILDEFQGDKIGIPPGMTKEAYLEFKLNEVIVEGEGLDLVTMGRGEGPECYCYPNLILRKIIDELAGNYAYVVMDNEAGMEHLSRRTTHNIDEMLLVSDHSVKGVRTLARIRDLISELRLNVKRESVIINYVPDGLDPRISEEMDKLGIVPAATIPFDEEVRNCDLEQKPIFELPDTSKAMMTVSNLMDRLIDGN